MNIGTISDPTLKIKPSKKLYSYIKNNVNSTASDMPDGIKNIVFKNPPSKANVSSKPSEPCYLLNSDDIKFIKTLNLNQTSKLLDNGICDTQNIPQGKLLTLPDLHWLYHYLNKQTEDKMYFHELFEGSEVILPKNDLIPRNQELEKRCQQYKNEFDNKEYHRMTQKINVARNRFPEDTIGYQLREMNKQMISVFQFVVSVLAGFAFGFIGVELILGNLDIGVRFVLGIMCALVIAVAELYFLIKRLNQEVNEEVISEKKVKSSKLD